MIRKLTAAIVFVLISSPVWATSNVTINYEEDIYAAVGGGSPTGSVFKSSGTFLYTEGTSRTFGFKTLPTTGASFAFPIWFSGTTLPSSVVDDDGLTLTRSTSTMDATAGMGTAVYYLQSSDLTDSTMTVVVTFAGSTQFGGCIVEAEQANTPMIDVSTGAPVRASLINSSTSPVTAATTQLGVTAYNSNASNPGQVFSILPAGWTTLGEFTDGSTGQAGSLAYRTGVALESVAVNTRWSSSGSGNRSTQSTSFFK